MYPLSQQVATCPLGLYHPWSQRCLEWPKLPSPQYLNTRWHAEKGQMRIQSGTWNKCLIVSQLGSSKWVLAKKYEPWEGWPYSPPLPSMFSKPDTSHLFHNEFNPVERWGKTSFRENAHKCLPEGIHVHTHSCFKNKAWMSHMVMHACNLSTQEVETGGLLQVCGQPFLCSEILSQKTIDQTSKQANKQNKSFSLGFIHPIPNESSFQDKRTHSTMHTIENKQTNPSSNSFLLTDKKTKQTPKMLMEGAGHPLEKLVFSIGWGSIPYILLQMLVIWLLAYSSQKHCQMPRK